jgi:hypothetical protein
MGPRRELSVACFVAAFGLIQCSGPLPSVPSSVTPALRAATGTKDTPLLYVAGGANGGVTLVVMYTYPKLQFVGQLKANESFARVCSDPKTGHVGEYITSVFAELRKGSKTLKDIALNQFLGYPQKLEWDGKYMALNEGGTISRVQVSGTKGTIVGTTTLQGDTEGAGGTVWIDGHTVFGPYGGSSSRRVGIRKYPAGGEPVSVTESIAKSVPISDINLSVMTPKRDNNFYKEQGE